MIPFFSHSQEEKTNYIVETVFGALVVKTLFALFSWGWGEAIVSIFLGLYLLREFLRWKLHPFHSTAILWILHMVLFWLPAALLLGGLIQILEMIYRINFLFAGIHLLVLGFLTTILIGFGVYVMKKNLFTEKKSDDYYLSSPFPFSSPHRKISTPYLSLSFVTCSLNRLDF